MKYLLVIPSGLCDQPATELDGQTPLAAAQTPVLDALAASGRLGQVEVCPPKKTPGAGVGMLTLLGYDPAQTQAGQAALEALGLGHEVLPGDWVLRLSFLTVKNGVVDALAPVRDAEAQAILEAFAPQFRLPGSVIRTGAFGRHMLVQPALSDVPHDWDALATCPPHELLHKPLAKHLPAGGDLGAILSGAVQASALFLGDHEINLTRLEMDEAPITHIWPWGPGRLPGLRPLPELLNLRCACVADPGLAVGVAQVAGMRPVKGMLDGSPGALALAASKALAENDLVVVRVNLGGPEGGYARVDDKVAAIEAFDADCVSLLRKALKECGEPWRMLVVPDHGTHALSGGHQGGPMPLLMAGYQVPHVVDARYTEAGCANSDMHIQKGEQLLGHFLNSGLGPERGGF